VQLRAGPHECLPTFAPVVGLPEQEDLGFPAAGAAALQSGGKDLRFVHHHEVARPDQVDEVAEEPMPDGSGCAIEHEQPALRPKFGRMLRDQLGGQVEIVIRGPTHASKKLP
jgi:hypothetical protein